MPVRRTRYVPEPSWIDRLNAVREYVAEHGRFPAPNSTNPAHAALAAWWMKTTAAGNLTKLSANRAQAVSDTFRLCDERREELKVQARAQISPRLSRINRDASRAAARAQIRHAVKALDNPFLLPGDRDILLLRINNPEDSLRDLASKAGMNVPAFAGRLRGALKRTELSSNQTRPRRQRLERPPSGTTSILAGRDAQIIDRLREGATQKAVAAEYGLSPGRISQILTAHRRKQ